MTPHLPRRRDPADPAAIDRPERSTAELTRYRGSSHVVRPRWSWTGLTLLIVGGIVAGVGVAVVSVTWIVAGVAVVAAGAGAAFFGGLFYDVEGTGGELVDGKRRVPGASAKASDPDLLDEIGREEAELAAIRSRQGVRPSLQRPAAYALLAVAAWLVLAQGAFYEQTPDGREGTYRAVAAALTIALPALYLARVAGSRVAAAVCAVGGVGLVLSGLLADHGLARSIVNEVACGVVVLALAPLAASRGARSGAGER